MSKKVLILAVGLILALVATQAFGEEQNAPLGQLEYETNCAVCHGVDGAGGGPYVELLTPPVPDLTLLQKNNGGVFPFERVYEVIDGREEVKAHGPRDMPIWGDRYDKDAVELGTMGEYVGDREAYLRARILALISHLFSLQK
jgi:mono/diheme cytochrome c family protein